VSDFILRLIARSSGEKSPVRPTVAPAFAPEVDRPRQSHAGEILQNPAEHLPAIAPLPFEALQQKENPNRAQPTTNLQSSKEDSRTPQQQAAQRDSAQRIQSHERREELQVRAQDQTTFETNVAASIFPRASRTEEYSREFVEPPRSSIAEARDVPTTAMAREIEPSREKEPDGLVVPATPLQPPVFAARPSPERKSEFLDENLRKKKTSEPVVQVTIGKIEVRASIASAKSAEKKTQSGVMSLEEYQRARNRRSAG
jgi:hypothetical protein